MASMSVVSLNAKENAAITVDAKKADIVPRIDIPPLVPFSTRLNLNRSKALFAREPTPEEAVSANASAKAAENAMNHTLDGKIK